MIRWGLKNTFNRVSLEAFSQAVVNLQDALSKTHPAGTQVNIKLYAGNVQRITTIEPEFVQYMVDANDHLLLANARDLSKVSAKAWARAKYADVLLNPVGAPDQIVGRVEALGNFPNQLTLYAWGQEPAIEDEIKRQMPEWEAVEELTRQSGDVMLRHDDKGHLIQIR